MLHVPGTLPKSKPFELLLHTSAPATAHHAEFHAFDEAGVAQRAVVVPGQFQQAGVVGISGTACGIFTTNANC